MNRTPGRPPLDEDDPESVPVCVNLPSKVYEATYQRAGRERVSVPEIIRRDMRTAAAKKYPK